MEAAKARQNSTATQPLKKCLVCGIGLNRRDADMCGARCRLADGAFRNPVWAATKARIPAKYKNANLGDFKGVDVSGVSKGIPSLKEFNDGGYPKEIDAIAALGDGLFLTGSAGIGKTHFAAALSKAYLPALVKDDYFNFVWVRSPDLLMHIRSSYNGGKESESRIVESYRQVGLLVIDDFGAEKVSDWSLSALYSILAGRIDDCRPTIVTSNLGLRDIDAWEPRIASRLAAFSTISLPKQDRRLSKV
jgi:DNA replication protein DnaC